MNTKCEKKVFALFLVFSLVLTMSTAVLLTASETDTGAVYSSANGDEYTVFDLKWDDPEKGIVSFETQIPGMLYVNDMVSTGFQVRVFKDGVSVGTTGVTNTSADTATRRTVDISKLIEEPGTYFFTVYFVAGPALSANYGQVSRSSEYIKTSDQSPASRVIGSTTETGNGDGYTPYNVRWIEPTEGIIAFDKQPVDHNHYTFDIIVYKDGQLKGGIYAQDGDEIKKLSIQSFMKEPGVYYFTVQYLSDDGTSMDNSAFGGGSATNYTKMGEAVRSPEYAYGVTGGNTTQPAEQPAEIAAMAPAEMAAPTPGAAGTTAYPTNSSVLIDGGSVGFEAYNIDGSNYFKLRDLAYALNGTAVQFDVGWDGERNAINLLSDTPYSGANEMGQKGSGEKSALLSMAQIFVDSEEVVLTAYNIEGSNYFMLRELGDIFGFGVDWDGTNILINTGGNGTDLPAEIETSGSNTDFSPQAFIDVINRGLVAKGYGKMILRDDITQFAQSQVDSYITKNDENGNIFSEGDTRGYMPLFGFGFPKNVSPMMIVDENSVDYINNIHLLDSNDFYVGLGFGEMGENNIIHIIAEYHWGMEP